MATFIPEIGDITPQVEYFRPDLEQMAGYLQIKQGQFNAARDELNTIYNQLKSLDLTLDDNKERREKFFVNVDQELKKLSNVDLSLPENITAAKRVFDPLVEDDAMMEDILFTSRLKNLAATAEKFRNSSIEEDRKRYNPQTLDFIALKQQEYINASPEARSSVANSGIRYASNVNLMEKATALAKEMDLNVSIDTVTGGYRVTNKNGQLVTPQLQQAFTDAFMSDPEVVDYYRQSSYIGIQSQIQSLVPSLGYDGAVAAISERLQASSELLFAKNLEEADKAKKVLESQARIIENKIETEGLVEGSEGHREYLNVLRNLEQAERNVEVSAQGLNISRSQMAGLDNLYDLGFQINLTQDIARAAQVLSDRGMEQSITEDKYYLESVKQQNRINLEILKSQLKESTSTGNQGDPNAPGWDPIDAAISAGARDRGAEMTEPAGNLDITSSKSALNDYIGSRDKLYSQFIANYLSKENGGYLSSAGSDNGKAVAENYLKLLETLNPADRAAQIERDLAEIKQSGHTYDAKVLESITAMETSIIAANQEINLITQQSAQLLMQNYNDPDQLELAGLLFDESNSLVSEERFVNNATDYINANIVRQDGSRGYDQDLYTDYRVPFDSYGSAYPTYAEADPDRIRELYAEIKNGIDNIYKNQSVNVHKYFDPDINAIGSQGSTRAFEVTASYTADPMTYYDEKKAGHFNSVQGYTVLAGTVMAGKNSDSYIYPGSMIENNYFGLDAFPDAEDYKQDSDNIGQDIIDDFIRRSKINNKSTTAGRAYSVIDVAKGVQIGNKRFVATQVTFSPDYIEGLKELNPNKYKDIGNTYTIFTPQESMPVGYFAGDGSGALMSSIINSGERTTSFPGGMGSVTYTYDNESGLIEVYGRIKELNSATGGYEFKQYVESTDEENFEIVRNSVWNVVQAAMESNEQKLKELEAAQNITRVTDPKKLK